MRSMMTPETIQHNCDCFKKQMERFIEFGEGKALMLNNADWLLKLNYIELLREVGACFSVNNMLRAECYKQRMEKGLSFLEFNYMIMQSYDFYHMFQTVGCNMQFGGDDQWSNMLGGTELIRRKLGKDAYAMTITLLMNSEGKKMGKTASGAVWLDPNKTSPYDFYQYWRNVGDADVLKCIRMLTFLPLEQIDEMDTWEGSQLNTAKEILAYELTKLVHGEEEAEKAQEAARALFGGGGDSANMPCTKLCRAGFHRRGRDRHSDPAGEVRPGCLQGRGPAAGAAGRRHRLRPEGGRHRGQVQLQGLLRRGRGHQKGQEGLSQGRAGRAVSGHSISPPGYSRRAFLYVPVRWQPHHSFYQQNGAGKGVDCTEQITYTRPEAEELVERWSDTVLRIAWTWTGSVHDAQDICQTVLLKLLTSPRRFDGGAAGAGLGGPGDRQLLQGLEEIRLGPAAPALGGGGPRGGPSAGARGEPCAGGGAGPAGAIPPGGVPAVLRGIRAGGDRDADGLHGQSGQHVSLPGQGKIAEHAGRRLWTGMLIRVSWTRYSSRKRGGPP